MKVAFLCSSFSRLSGGIHPVMLSLVRNLISRNVEIKVFAGLDRYSYIDTPSNILKHCVFLDLVGPRAYSYMPKLKRKINEFSPDIIHSHGLWMYVSSATYALKNTYPYIVSPHGMLDSWALNNARIKKIAATYLFERKNIGSAKFVHALNSAEEKSVFNFNNSASIVVIPNGVELQPNNARAINGDRRIKKLIYIGRLHEKKNVLDLIFAWKKVCDESLVISKEWYLSIAGWGGVDYENSVRKLISEMHAYPIEFCGSLYGDRKKAFFESASAFILPSSSEGSPVAVLEAFSYGVPVLMTSACNLEECFENNSAYKIRADMEYLSTDITLALIGEDLSDTGNRGLDMARDYFSWGVITDKYMTLYESIL